MRALETKIPPPVVALLCAWLMWSVARFVPGAGAVGDARDTWALLLALAGLAVELAGIASFLRARTTADPTHPASATSLVTSGIYRFTRNPMYLGDAVILLAWSLHLASLPALIGVAAFVGYIEHFQIPAEERAMSELFGPAYGAYRTRVRRWV